MSEQVVVWESIPQYVVQIGTKSLHNNPDIEPTAQWEDAYFYGSEQGDQAYSMARNLAEGNELVRVVERQK